jgi:hypothetical protein
MHAITKLKRDIAFSRRRTQAAPLRNVEKSVQPTTEPAAKRRKANEQTAESNLQKAQDKNQKDLFEERL